MTDGERDETTGVETDAAPAGLVQQAGDRRGDRPAQGPGELVTGLSPRQIMGGFALAAALLLLLRRSRRPRQD